MSPALLSRARTHSQPLDLAAPSTCPYPSRSIPGCPSSHAPHSQQFNEIMPTIYKRFMEKEAKDWREIYKVNSVAATPSRHLVLTPSHSPSSSWSTLSRTARSALSMTRGHTFRRSRCSATFTTSMRRARTRASTVRVDASSLLSARRSLGLLPSPKPRQGDWRAPRRRRADPLGAAQG